VPFTNHETPNATTAVASRLNSTGQLALTEDGRRFDAAARATHVRITIPHTR
jgi:hypothetical protein